MKIIFDNENSWVEFKRHEDKIYITISAPHGEDPNSIIVNSASVTEKEFNSLLKDINNVSIVSKQVETEPIIEEVQEEPVKKKRKPRAKKSE